MERERRTASQIAKLIADEIDAGVGQINVFVSDGGDVSVVVAVWTGAVGDIQAKADRILERLRSMYEITK